MAVVDMPGGKVAFYTGASCLYERWITGNSSGDGA